MATFKDTLKKWFYTSGTRKIAAGRRICLLDASGDPIGSDTIENIRKLVGVDSNKYVDMGLPSGTLWAKRNLGALKETDNGWYFSWGNLTGHSEGSGYAFTQANYNASPAAAISADLTLAQDAARANKGCAWRMPSKEESAELFNSEYTEFIDANGTVISGTDKRTTYNGVVGLRIRSKTNGNTLFVPAAGRYNGTTLQSSGSDGFYWLSTWGSATNARCLHFGSSSVDVQGDYNGRHIGFTIRPVV